MLQHSNILVIPLIWQKKTSVQLTLVREQAWGYGILWFTSSFYHIEGNVMSIWFLKVWSTTTYTFVSKQTTILYINNIHLRSSTIYNFCLSRNYAIVHWQYRQSLPFSTSKPHLFSSINYNSNSSTIDTFAHQQSLPWWWQQSIQLLQLTKPLFTNNQESIPYIHAFQITN